MSNSTKIDIYVNTYRFRNDRPSALVGVEIGLLKSSDMVSVKELPHL